MNEWVKERMNKWIEEWNEGKWINELMNKRKDE